MKESNVIEYCKRTIKSKKCQLNQSGTMYKYMLNMAPVKKY